MISLNIFPIGMAKSGKTFNMYQGEELSYNEFWHFIKERKDIKWYVMAYGGNFSFLRTSLKNYLKVA